MSRTGDFVYRMARFFDHLTTSIGDLGADSVFVGLTPEEIAQVKVDQSVDELPLYYEEFLSRMGKSAGPFLVGTDVFYPRILGLKKDGLELLAENGVPDLMPRDAVVIAMHQGYQLYWLYPSSEENPPVFMYEENELGVHRQWESFSAFLVDELQDEIDLIR